MAPPWAVRSHGFAAAGFAVVRLLDLHDVARLEQDLADVHQHFNSREDVARQRIALAQQALLPLARSPDVRTRSIPRPALKLTLTRNPTGHIPAE